MSVTENDFPVKSFKKLYSYSWKRKKKKIESNVNNITTDNSFQSHVAMNAQKKDANMSYKRRLASGIIPETIK